METGYCLSFDCPPFSVTVHSRCAAGSVIGFDYLTPDRMRSANMFLARLGESMHYAPEKDAVAPSPSVNMNPFASLFFLSFFHCHIVVAPPPMAGSSESNGFAHFEEFRTPHHIGHSFGTLSCVH